MAVNIHWSVAPSVAIGTQTTFTDRDISTPVLTCDATTQTAKETKDINTSEKSKAAQYIQASHANCKMGVVHTSTQALSWIEIVDKILSRVPVQESSADIDTKWMYIEDVLSILIKRLASRQQQSKTSVSTCTCMKEIGTPDDTAELEPNKKLPLATRSIATDAKSQGKLVHHAKSTLCKQSKRKTHKHRKNVDNNCLPLLSNCKGMTKANSSPKSSKVGKRQYKCQFCCRICATSTNLAIHERIHTGEKPYSCSHCDKSFSSKTKVTIHERLHTGDKPFKCSFCDAHFVSSSYMSKHIKAMHTGKPHVCKTCGKDFLFKTQLIEHERSHTGLTPFKCQHCKKSFSLKSNLVAHVKRVHVANRPHQCELCEVTFHGKTEYRLHLQTHNAEPSCLCEQCGKSFHRSDYLARHIRTVHNEKRVKPHVCPFCSKRLARKHVLVLHIRAKHTFEKPFKCPHCIKTWVSKHDLDRHIRTHTGEKPYRCQQCHKQFKSSSNFAKHRKSHIKEDNTIEKSSTPSNSGAENQISERAIPEETRDNNEGVVRKTKALAHNIPSSNFTPKLTGVKRMGENEQSFARTGHGSIGVPVNQSMALLPSVFQRTPSDVEVPQLEHGTLQGLQNPITVSGTEQAHITHSNTVSNTAIISMGSFISALQTSLVPGYEEETVNQERQNQQTGSNGALITGMPVAQMLQHSSITSSPVANPLNHHQGNHSIMSIGGFLSPILQNRMPSSSINHHDNNVRLSASLTGNQVGPPAAPLIVSMLQQNRSHTSPEAQRHQEMVRNDQSYNLPLPSSATWQEWYQ